LNAIVKRGYFLIYLTARPIGMTHRTKKFLNWITEGDKKEKLPDGPLLLSPDKLYKAFKREVILKTPQEFKIPLLEDLKKCFEY